MYIFKWIPEQGRIRVYADKTQMNRLFTNLLQNALEACHDREICVISVQEELKDDQILISISDNGEGIPEKMQSKIFIPNFTTKSSGTGLGLAMSKTIVEQAKGRIWFETREGTGTTFFVEPYLYTGKNLSKTAAMKNKIEVIDFIKGYSILSIVLFHYCQRLHLPSLLSKAINFGGTGIHTFLFASGFGLFLSHLPKPLGYGDFLKKRFTKIYIPYIIIVTLSALISLVIPLYENTWNNYFSHVFIYKMFDNHLIGTYGYQLWFISTIIQFYLLFPLIVNLRIWMPGRIFSGSWSDYLLCLGFLISRITQGGRQKLEQFFPDVPLGVYAGDVLRRYLPEKRNRILENKTNGTNPDGRCRAGPVQCPGYSVWPCRQNLQ